MLGAPGSAATATRLIVNADDFGFTRDVNAGIILAHRRGILTATTLMANGPAFEDAIRAAEETPELDVGCHLVLVGGRSVRQPAEALPPTVPHMLWALGTGRLEAYSELAAQVERILAAGLTPTHLDTHKHTHLHPRVLEAVVRISENFRIAWVRRPFDYPMQAGSAGGPWIVRLAGTALGLTRRRFERVLREHGCRMTDHFAGFRWTGQYRTRDLLRLIASLPEGLTEFMCHPGHCTEELRRAPTRLKESRERELEALLSAQAREALEKYGVALTRYRDC